MPRIEQRIIEDLLGRVQKPGRYIGGELGSIVKDRCRVRMALSYPDLYDVGMSNNGIRILYDIVNAIPGAACERVFAVAPDFEQELRRAGVPLYTLETFTPLNELDLLGFNVSHELLATNILQVLDLGGIPLRAQDRKDGDPIVIAGGEAVSNPFPLADFIDAFFIGDGEDGIAEIAGALIAAREAGMTRDQAIGRIGEIGGVLLPRRYESSYDGFAARVSGPRVDRRVFRGRCLADPAGPIVPNIRIAQERAVVEVTRGCGNFCNFCHAGFYDLPYRIWDYREAARRIFDMIDKTGYNEVTLSSLSISDYPGLEKLLNEILPGLTERGVSVSLPSLRVDPATLPIIEIISEVRRASLTFAVESASDLMRARANKRLSLDDLLGIVRRVHERGWKVIKLYFMIGLPGCEEHDEAEDIIRLLREISRIGRGMDINVTVSPFVPKPHTPFQDERQMGRDYFQETVRRIKRGLPRQIKIKNHDPDASVLEGILARGDARLGGVIERVYRDGCRFDSWDEHFRFDAWRAVLDELMPGWTERLGARGGEGSPWGVVATGFERVTARRKAVSLSEKPAPARVPRRRDEIDANRVDEARKHFERRFAVERRVRIRFAKTGLTRFIPHLDFMEILKRGLRMAGAPVAMTQGFNKRERISAGFPLPLGIESEAELIDADLFEEVDDGLAGRLGARLPMGISVIRIRPIDGKESLMAVTGVVEYRVEAPSTDTHLAVIRGCAQGISLKKKTKGGVREVQSADVLHSFEEIDGAIILRLRAGSEQSIRIDQAVSALTGVDAPGLPGFRIIKTAQYRVTEGGLAVIE